MACRPKGEENTLRAGMAATAGPPKAQSRVYRQASTHIRIKAGVATPSASFPRRHQSRGVRSTSVTLGIAPLRLRGHVSALRRAEERENVVWRKKVSTPKHWKAQKGKRKKAYGRGRSSLSVPRLPPSLSSSSYFVEPQEPADNFPATGELFDHSFASPLGFVVSLCEISLFNLPVFALCALSTRQAATLYSLRFGLFYFAAIVVFGWLISDFACRVTRPHPGRFNLDWFGVKLDYNKAFRTSSGKSCGLDRDL